MKQRARVYYTETDKSLMWDRWQKADVNKPTLCSQLESSERHLLAKSDVTIDLV